MLRLTRVFAPGEPLLAGWARAPARARPVDAFADMVAAPVHVDHVVTALLAIARAARARASSSSRRGARSRTSRSRATSRRASGPPADLVRPVAAATRGIAPGEAPRHASLACDEFLARFGLAPIEPFDVVDAVLGCAGSR